MMIPMFFPILPRARRLWGLLVVGLALAACGGEGPPENPPAGDVELPRTLAWSAYQTGTAGYSQAVAIGNVLQRQYAVNLRVVPGRNDVSRLATLRANRVNMSAGGSEAVYAQEGILNFASRIWGPQPLRIILSNFSPSCSFTFATAADADIHSIDDIRGKRVTFVQGAPSLNNATTALLSYAELTWDDVERVEVGGYNASVEAIINNRADVAGGACNSTPFLRVESSPRGLRFVRFPHDNPAGIQRVRDRLPWYVPHVAVEGPTIPPEGIEVFTSAYPLLVTMDTMNEEWVYGLAKIMHLHFDDYKNSAPGGTGWAIEGQKLANAFLPYHDGAVRYFRELGLWTEEAEARHQANLHRQQVLKETWEAFLLTAPEDHRAFQAEWLKVREQALEARGMLTLADSQ